MYVGYDNDIYRTTYRIPRQDKPGLADTYSFGSAHPGAFNMLYCDGSVRPIAYNIDLATFKRGGNRH